MPTINVSSSTSEASKTTLADRYNADPSYVSGAESLIRRSARDVIKKQDLWDRKVQEAERQNYAYDVRFEQKRRQQLERELRQDAQADSRWRRMHDQAERQDILWEKTQQKKKQTGIDRFNARFTRQQDQHASAQYRFMRADADAMNRQHDRLRAQSAGGYGYGGGMGGYGGGYSPRTIPGQMGHAAGKFLGRKALNRFAPGIARAFGLADMAELGGAAAAGGLAGGPLGEAAVAAGAMAAVAGGVTWESPTLYGKLLGDAVGGSQKYYQLTSSAARLGRGGGMRAQGLIDGVFKGGAAPAWMAKYGLSPEGALDWASKTGIPVSSMTELRSLDTSIGAASTSQGLGGLGTDTIASMLGTFNRLSGSRNNPGAAGNFDGHGGAMMGQANTFLRKWESLTTVAVTRGLDASDTASTLKNVLQGITAGGAVGLDASKTPDFISRLQAGGNGWMRSGQGVASAADASTRFNDGAGLGGGSPPRTMAAVSEVMRRNYGKLPTTMAQLEKVYGFSYSALSPSDQRSANLALQAGRAGDQLAFVTLSSGLASADPQFALNASNDYANSLGLPPYKAAIIASALFGGDTSAKSQSFINSWQVGKNSKLPGGTLGYADLPSGYSDMIAAAAKRAGVDPALLAGQVSIESNFNPNAHNTTGGGFGAIGLMQVRKPALDQLHKMGFDLDVKGPSDLYDPATNLRVGGDYLRYVKGQAGNNEALGLAMYGGGPGNPNFSYANQVESRSLSFAANPEARQNQANASLAQAQMVQSYQQSVIAGGLTGGPIGGAFEAVDIQAKDLAAGLASLGAAVKAVVMQIRVPTHVANTQSNLSRPAPRAP